MGLEILETTCCVVLGGPAGIMLGYLLTRNGVQVAVLEKHQDFLRDFRGDTVHPIHSRGAEGAWALGRVLDLPHQKAEPFGMLVGDSLFDVVDFRHVPVTCKFIALMPQWDFLNFFPLKQRAFPRFSCSRNTKPQIW